MYYVYVNDIYVGEKEEATEAYELAFEFCKSVPLRSAAFKLMLFKFAEVMVE